jgi:hypothetical protein
MQPWFFQYRLEITAQVCKHISQVERLASSPFIAKEAPDFVRYSSPEIYCSASLAGMFYSVTDI